MPRKKVMVSLLMTEEMNERFKELAQKSKRSKAAYIRQVLRRYIEYLDTRDDPNAKPINWDIDRCWYFVSPDCPEVGLAGSTLFPKEPCSDKAGGPPPP